MTRNLTRQILNRSYVLSPYPSANKDFVKSTIELHVKNFIVIAGLCDIIAI